MGSMSSLTEENYDSFLLVMRYTWSICIGFSVVGMVFSWFRGGKNPQSD